MSESKVNIPANKGNNLWAYIAGIICSACVFLGSLFTLWQSVLTQLWWQGFIPSSELMILFRNTNLEHLSTTIRCALIASVIAAVLSLGVLVFLLVRMLIKRKK